MIEDTSLQRISRLTPLEAVRDLIDAQVAPVTPQRWAIADTYGYTLADDVVSFECPKQPIALRDGFAVEAAAVADASSYAPVPLPPAACRVEVGQALPGGADAVLSLDAVTLRGAHAEAVAPVTAGEGVLPAGGDTAPQAILRRAGERMRSVDLAILHAAGIKDAAVRVPRIAVIPGGAQGTRPLHAALGLLIRAASAAGVTVSGAHDITLEAAVADRNNDAIVAVGGTGRGRHDAAVQALARLGRVELHGIAISPGETAAFGFAGKRPVLLVPGRIDAALAAWLLIGRQMAAKLCGGHIEDSTTMLPLKRKVASAIGMTEVVPVNCKDGMAEPLASGYLSFMSLTLSHGWIVVPAESEGFPAGTQVAVQPWP